MGELWGDQVRAEAFLSPRPDLPVSPTVTLGGRGTIGAGERCLGICQGFEVGQSCCHVNEEIELSFIVQIV